MQKQILLRPDFLLPLWGSFLRWYFYERPQVIVKAYLVYSKAFREIFSILFLLKTLLKPWKNITDKYPAKGFNVNLILETFTLNCVTRIAGAVIRIAAIAFGLGMQLALVVGFGGYLLLWYTFPAVFLAGISFVLLSL